MMESNSVRQVVLDTETTGHEASKGDRVVEIGCLELIDRRPTGQYFHCYLNPDRDSHPEALRVHGLTTAFLSDKPRMPEVVEDFLDFVRGSELIIHNAAFDVGFLDAELERCGAHYGTLSQHVVGVLDTLKLAKEKYPGQRNSLDALCRRFGVDNSGRELHGALLDAGLLLDVYLMLTGGQFDLDLSLSAVETTTSSLSTLSSSTPAPIRVVSASAEEAASHEARLQEIEKRSGKLVWARDS